MNFSFTIFLQRMIELLALYLILANINGKSLKEAFEGLFRTNQRRLYENSILFLGYVLVITVVIQEMGDVGGTMISHVTQPFIGLLLVKTPEIKQAFLATTFSFIFAGIVAPFNVFISLHPLINFGLTLAVVTLMVQRNYLHKTYAYLINRKASLNLVCFISFLIYVAPLLVRIGTDRTALVATLLLTFFLLITFLVSRGIEQELSRTIDLITQSSYDEMLLLLQELSCQHEQSEVVQYFIIKEKSPSTKLIDILSKKLEEYKVAHLIRAYECRATKGQIKISIILND